MVDFMTHDPFCQGMELLWPVEIRSGNVNECPSQRNLVKVMCHFRTETLTTICLFSCFLKTWNVLETSSSLNLGSRIMMT